MSSCSKPWLEHEKACYYHHQGQKSSTTVVKSISDMSEHYVPTDINDIPRTRLGNPKYRGWLPSKFGADKQYWEKKGFNPCKLLNDTYLIPHTGRQTGVHQTMPGVPVHTRSDALQIMYQNFIAFPPSLHVETQAKIDEFISEEFENDIRVGPPNFGATPRS
jgi:hypothetical protein